MYGIQMDIGFGVSVSIFNDGSLIIRGVGELGENQVIVVKNGTAKALSSLAASLLKEHDLNEMRNSAED